MSIINNYALFIYFIIGTLSGIFAYKNKRNPYLWFALGVFFGVFALMILLFLKYKKKTQNLSKPLQQQMQPVLSIVPKKPQFWYYLDQQNIKSGPISFSKLQNLWKENKIFPTTYVWTEDFEDWKYLKDIKEYRLFQEKI